MEIRLSKLKRIDPILVVIILVAAFLNIYGIWNDQYSNAYYTAAVTSMLQNFHNFFFASFDPGGFVTVDKPPVAFWIQTLFAYLFGVHGWSVILPQALAGVGSVLLIYILVKPSFGKTAARLAALVAACTPIAVAVSRTNNVDSFLVFTLLAATWMLFKAVKTKKWLWCIAAFAIIGIGFNIKMLQAYMVLPAFYLFYWLAFKVNWKKKLSILAASTVVLLLVSLSWPLIVDSIPKENRPYIGSSKTNSVLELAFGYNGISRLTGMRGPGGNRGGSEDGQLPGQRQDAGLQIPDNQQRSQTPGQDGTGQRPAFAGNNPLDQMRAGGQDDGGPRGGGMFNTGSASPLRLFQSQLSGQISWLLPFALLAAIGLLIGIRRKQPLTAKQKESLFWLAWLLPMMGFFSIAGFFHQYYLIMLAPAIAALTGAGWVELSGFHRNCQGWKRSLLPVSLLGTTLFQVYILLPYQNQIGLVLPVVIGVIGSGLSLILCLPSKLQKPSESINSNHKQQNPNIDFASNTPATGSENNLTEENLPGSAKTRTSLISKIKNVQLKTSILRTATVTGMLLLLAAPLYWSATPLLYGDNSMLPEAGPQFKSSGNRSTMPDRIPDSSQEQMPNQMSGQISNQTPDQLPGQIPDQMANQPQNRMPGGSQENVEDELLAYLTAHNTGEKYLFATTNAGTAEAYIIKTGKAVMAMGGFSGSDPILTVDKIKQMIANKEVKYFLISLGGPGGNSSDVQTWIRQNGKEIPRTEWQANPDNSRGDTGMNGSSTLYEVSP